jgi:tetratricopeptide (TPR) repeat protein
VTGFGVAAWTAAAPGDALIEAHDETTSGAGAHEELYLVLAGRATFTVADEEVDAPAGTLLLIDVGTRRSAIAAEADTSVLVIGGRPGAVLPASPFEHYYAAQPAYDAGDYDRAIAIASEGLRDHPDNPLIHYQLACYNALAGRLDEAREHLDVAFAGDERTRKWAAEDEDLAALRE